MKVNFGYRHPPPPTFPLFLPFSFGSRGPNWSCGTDERADVRAGGRSPPPSFRIRSGRAGKGGKSDTNRPPKKGDYFCRSWRRVSEEEGKGLSVSEALLAC